MTVWCTTFGSSPTLNRYASGESDAAQTAERGIRETIRHYKEPQLKLLQSEIEEIAAETNATPRVIPIDAATVDAAMAFASQLPRSLPAPQVAPDPDGEISFDWMGRSGKIFSVSINAVGRLAYAGRFGEKSKVHGTEQLAEDCLPEIIRGIARAIR
jgi:hypothetical protein